MLLESSPHYSSLVTWTLSCWKIQFPVGMIDIMQRGSWSAVTFRESRAFMICFTIKNQRAAHDNVPQSIIPPPSAYLNLLHKGEAIIRLEEGVPWRNNRNDDWEIVIHLATLFNLSMSSLDVSGPNVGIVDDGVWLTQAKEWDNCCAVPYSEVSTELYVWKLLRINIPFVTCFFSLSFSLLK